MRSPIPFCQRGCLHEVAVKDDMGNALGIAQFRGTDIESSERHRFPENLARWAIADARNAFHH